MAECVASQKTIDILICPICLERFTKPKYVPCLHTFCEGCILTYSTSILEKLEGKNQINCPVCRATVQLPNKECTPKEFVDQLPANFLIIGLLEKEKVTRPEKLCMSCERLDITSNATFICMDCTDTLCDTCQKYHKSNKATSNHAIKPIFTLTDEEKIPNAFKNICAQHCKKLKLFCNDHDVPCCTLCVSLNHRKCDNVVTIEEKAKSFCTDAKFEKLKMDIGHVSHDFDTLLSHYAECLQCNKTQYEGKQKMIEISCSNIISKVKAMEIKKKAELKKIYEEKKHILEDRMDTCTNCKKTVVSDKQTLEVSIEKASEVQVVIEAQKIASQIEKYKQLLRNYKLDGSKILICFGTGIPIAIDVFINSLFKISVRNEVKFLELLTDETSPSFNSVQNSSLNQSVGCFWNPNKDIKIKQVLSLHSVLEKCHRLLPEVVRIFLPHHRSHRQPLVLLGTYFQLLKRKVFFAGKSSRETSPVKSTSKDHTDKYKPNVDFKPVIDLSDLVETKTGEEEEEVVFCERAKLFRFDDAQWKERGTGELKLSRHEQTQRVRLLMRRDQVLKVCANHFLTTEMKLSPMLSSKKAWCLNAQDFSEGKIQIETLAVRFEDEDLALKFKTTFEKLQSELDQVKSNQAQKDPAKTVTTNKPSLGSMFKKDGGSWSCPACLVSNKLDVQKCAACQTLKPGLKPEDIKQTESKSSNIFGSTSVGIKFGNTTSEQKSSGVSFQSGAKPTSAADIKFGQITTAADNTTPATGSGFKFGGQTVSTVKTTTAEADTGKLPLSGGFEFGKLPESDQKKAPPGAVSFRQTVFSASDKKTEPSKSDLFITEPRKSTLGGLTFQKTAKPGFSFGGETKCNTSIFTFKPSAPIATASSIPAVTETNNKPVSFKPSTLFESSTSISKPEPAKKDEKKGFENQFKQKAGSWNCYGCLVSNNNNVLKCLSCGTLKQGVRMKDLPKETKEFSAFGSSTGGFNFGGKGVTKEEAKESGQHEKKEGKKGFGDLFKPKEGAWKCDDCLVSNNGDVLKCPACGTLKPGVKKEALPKETEKSSAFGSTTGGFNFGGKGGFTFGTAGISDTNAGSGFTFPTSDSTKDKSESKPAFAGFTFTPTKSDAEKNKPDAAAKGFNFTLQPSATPGKRSGGFSFTLSPSNDVGPKSPPTDADGMYLNKDGDDDHIHFEPIIELPSVVNVVTGEEDEEILFQHRAKLYRFVDGEWKERGLGDIKISKHKESGKVRLLMRREQIHKICLNHYLTQELGLKPMPKTDEKAWIWFAMDFSDDEPTMQQLAVKFKNQEIPTGFKTAFDDAKVKLESSVTTQKSPIKSVVNSDDRNDGIEFVREEQATKEQIAMARKFLLPDHFYLYGMKPSCPGCIGCEDYEPGKKIHLPNLKFQLKLKRRNKMTMNTQQMKTKKNYFLKKE